MGEVLAQWRGLKFEVVSNVDLKNRLNTSLWETIPTHIETNTKDIIHLALIYMAILVSAAENERIMSTIKHIKIDQGSSLHVSTTDDLIRISNDTVIVASYQPDANIKSWMTPSVRQRRPQYRGWPSFVGHITRSLDDITHTYSLYHQSDPVEMQESVIGKMKSTLSDRVIVNHCERFLS